MPSTAATRRSAAWQQLLDDQRARGRALLDRAHAQARSRHIACEAHLIDNPSSRVGDAIAVQAREHRCDLILMGTHGRRGMNRLVLGSDAERVMRLAPCAVLLVRKPDKT